jgi:murein L,D-transpeptidase YcbB/YkuD
MRIVRIMAASLALFGMAALPGCERPAPPPAAKSSRAFAPVRLDPEIAALYAERGHRPLWVAGGALKPEAEDLVRRIETATADGLDPAAYAAAELRSAVAGAADGDRRALAHADLLLTRALATYGRDLRRAPARGTTRYVDDGLAPEVPPARALLEEERLADGFRLNPLYEAMRRGVLAWHKANPRRSAGEEALVRANLERARAIPARQGRYVIVDIASARLWMIDGSKVEGPMRVIVGKPAMKTPDMAGLIRFVVLNPYWNMPPDLARERAKRVLREGAGWIGRERFQILSDWGDNPHVLKPGQVNWRAVAAGKTHLRMRQLPGGANVMGKIKFMMPNDLGIYLHDFPDKSLFGREDRSLSSGCIRVEDAPRLARWMFGGKAPGPSGPRPEQRVDLPEPVPVYISYFTALPDPARGIAFQPDIYGRDRAVVGAAQLSAR